MGNRPGAARRITARGITPRTIRTAVRERHESDRVVCELLYRAVMQLVDAGPVAPAVALAALDLARDEIEELVDRVRGRMTWEE